MRGKHLLILLLALVGAVNADILHTSRSENDIDNRELESEDTVTTFCVIADAPYNEAQRVKLITQVQNMKPECEFVVHLGDIRDGKNLDKCIRESYTNASRIMKQCDKPVIMVIGDNEYNDCSNPSTALGYWHQAFDGFLQAYWPDNDLDVSSQSGRRENVYFVRKRALFIALNLVGGRIQDKKEWSTRLAANFEWTKSLIEEHVFARGEANLVVVMGHADNFANTRPFFNNMRDYIDNELDNKVPILHLNGDTHYWKYQSNYLSQSNWLRITVDGETKKPPLIVTVDSSHSDINDAVSYNRNY